MLRPAGRALRRLLFAHTRWANGSLISRPIDLRGADLSWMDFSKRDLRGANFSRSNCEGTDFTGAKLMGANFSGANLHRARIDGSDMSFAVLKRTHAAFVRFKGVNLTGVSIEGADFTGADLSAAIWGTDQESRLFAAKFNIVPEGEIIGWKRLRDGRLAKLLIPAEAKRLSGLSRKCRAQYAMVLGVAGPKGEPEERGVSKRDPNLFYTMGEVVKADGWDDDWRNECAPGINFFITREEAEAY